MEVVVNVSFWSEEYEFFLEERKEGKNFVENY